jgi:hypothetical protein
MRFTIAACLALTALIAVLCFLLTTKPSAVSYMLMIAIIVFAPVCALGGIVYGRDNLRAFCIGAAFPLVLLVWSSSANLQQLVLHPSYYGWPAQVNQTTPDSTSTGNSGTAPSRPRNPNLSSTVSRAREMTPRTCGLSIAAIISGGMMMAIRGGLKQKESEPNHQPRASSL